MNSMLKQRLRMVNIGGAAAVILLLAATAAFGVYPMFKKGKAYDNDARDLQAKMTELNGLTTTLQDAERAMQQTDERLKAREDQLPSAEKEPNFYGNELTQIKKADNIQLASTDISKELKAWNGYKVGYIDLRGTGDWNSCVKFLADVNAMKGLTRLDSVVLNVSHDGSEQSYTTPTCEFHVSFSIFFKTR